MNSVVMALIATVGTWLITALGAATVVLFKSPARKMMDLMLGFSAGVMIAASFWSLLEPAISQAALVCAVPPYIVAAVGFLSGAIFMWLSDKTVSRINKHKDSDKTSGRLNRIIMLVLSITIHNIPEGLAVGVAFGSVGHANYAESLVGAITVALGIGIQNFPEGAAVSLPLRREGYSRMRSFLIGQASAMVEPIFGVLGAYAVLYIKSLLPYALSFAAGAMILVAVHELIPECRQNESENPYLATMGIIAGFTVMMILDVWLS